MRHGPTRQTRFVRVFSGIAAVTETLGFTRSSGHAGIASRAPSRGVEEALREQGPLPEAARAENSREPRTRRTRMPLVLASVSKSGLLSGPSRPSWGTGRYRDHNPRRLGFSLPFSSNDTRDVWGGGSPPRVRRTTGISRSLLMALSKARKNRTPGPGIIVRSDRAIPYAAGDCRNALAAACQRAGTTKVEPQRRTRRNQSDRSRRELFFQRKDRARPKVPARPLFPRPCRRNTACRVH